MKLNQKSTNALLKNTTDVVVYGLESCKYIEVAEALSSLHYKIHTAAEYNLTLSIPFISHREKIFSNSKLMISDECKHIVVNLIFENYKRIKSGKPIIPLIFCIGIEDDFGCEQLSRDRLFEESCLIANKELRRCYRIYAETTLNIRKIALETFKFVNVKQNPSDKDEYFLEEMPSFWDDDYFKQKWQVRVSDPNRPSQVNERLHPKQHKWKSELFDAIKLFDQANTAVDTSVSEPRRGLRSRL